MVGLAGLWEQQVLHKVLSPIPSSIQAVGYGGKGMWPLVALGALMFSSGSFAGSLQCLLGWDFSPPQAQILHQALISCPPASLCPTPRAWSSLEWGAQAWREMLCAAGTGSSFCPLFLDTATAPRPSGLHSHCQFPGENDSQLCQMFNFWNKQNFAQAHPAHHVFVEPLTSCCHLAPEPKGEFWGLQVVNCARDAAGRNF